MQIHKDLSQTEPPQKQKLIYNSAINLQVCCDTYRNQDYTKHAQFQTPQKKVQYITYNYIPAPLSFEKWNGYLHNLDSKIFVLIIPQIHKGHELLLTQMIQTGYKLVGNFKGL